MLMRYTRRPGGRQTTRFVVRWYRLVTAVFFGTLAITLAAMVGPELSNPAAVTVGFPGVGLALIATIRSARSATIEFRKEEVVLHELLRTKRIPLSHVRSVGVTGGSTVMLAWRVPYFELNDGSAVRAEELRSLREPSIVDDVVDEARRRLQR